MSVYTGLNTNNALQLTSHLNKSSSSQFTNTQTSQCCLLIVSQDRKQRELLQEHATTWGIKVVLANSAAQGFMRLKETAQLGYNIQLGLVEHHIPDINGIEFVRICRHEREISFFPIILLTSALIQLNAEEITQLGIIEQLLIPFSTSRLHDTLAYVIQVNNHEPSPSKMTTVTPVMIDKNSTPYKILVVEDSLLNRNLIVAMLKRLGHTQVDTAENGQEALEKVAVQGYALILMDCQMPILDGYVTAREIRRREMATDQMRTPIIALTAYALPEHRLAAQAADMDEHVAKPIRLNTLAQVLTRWLGAKQFMPIAKNQEIDTTVSLDLKIIEGLHAILGETTYSLLHQFIEYAPVQVLNLKHLMNQQAFEQLRRKAHQFKGESAQIGAAKLAQLCREIEECVKKQEINQLTDHLRALENEVKQVNLILEQQIARILQLDNSI